MPKELFKRINNDKKNSLLNIARFEFTNNNYEDVSINQIVKKANISRGSFYSYFENKDDLYFYLISVENEKIQKEILKNYNRMDIFELLLYIYNYFYENIYINNKRFIRKILSNFNPNTDFRIRLNYKNSNDNFYDIFFDEKYYGKYNLSKEEFMDLLEIIYMVFLKAIIETIFKQENVSDKLTRQINLLKNATK